MNTLISIKQAILDTYRWCVPVFTRPLLKYEQRKPAASWANERAVEWQFALTEIAAQYPRTILDVGSGDTAWPHLLANCGFNVRAIDVVARNRHYLVERRDITNPSIVRDLPPVDIVTCISTLEHIANYDTAIRHMSRLGRRLILTFPFHWESHLDDVRRKPTSALCQAFSITDVMRWCEDNDLHEGRKSFFQCWSGSTWSEGLRILPPRRVNSYLGLVHLADLACIVLTRR